MDSPAPRSAVAPGLPRLVVFLLVAGFAAYAAFLAAYSASYASGSDSSGYFNSARLLGAGRFHAPLRLPLGEDHLSFGLMAFQPLGFIIDREQPRMAPTYPTGLPLHLLAAAGLAGWRHAATVVNIVAALGTGLILWQLARRLDLTPGWSVAALALVWLCPLTLFVSLQPMSDLLALLWSLITLWLALRSREHWRWSLLAGLAASVAVLVRPTNLLLALPVALALGGSWRRYLLLGLGGLPGALFLGYYNRQVYGMPFTSGYGDIAATLQAGFVPHNLVHFARWIPALLSPLVLAALAAPFVPAARRHELGVLGLWAGLLIGFYSFYFHSGETWWYLRFILPAFPGLVLAALVVLQQGWQRWPAPRWSRIAFIIVLGLGLGWQIRLTRQLDVLHVPQNEATYLHAADWARGHLPPESAVFCMQVSGALYFYTEFMIVRWDQVAPDQIGRLFTALQAERRPIYAMLYAFEQPSALTRLGGRWRQIATIGQAAVWQLETVSP